MTEQQLINLVKEISESELDIDINTHLVDDLQFDSLKFIDLLVMLEGEFGLLIPEEKMIDIQRLTDIVIFADNT